MGVETGNLALEETQVMRKVVDKVNGPYEVGCSIGHCDAEED